MHRLKLKENYYVLKGNDLIYCIDIEYWIGMVRLLLLSTKVSKYVSND